MTILGDIKLVVFDMFGTLVRNDASEWQQTLTDIASQQRLPVEGQEFYQEWAKREVNFRKTRTNMAKPDASPPFRSYWEAWRQAFIETFDAMGLMGDADAAATYSIDALSDQQAFPDANSSLQELAKLTEIAVLSNADDRFLYGTIDHNGWQFTRVMSSERAQAYKPDPRIFAQFLLEVGVDPDSVLYVGDSPYDDVHGAKLAGLRAVLVERDQNTPGRTPPPDAGALLKADFIVGSLSELPRLFA